MIDAITEDLFRTDLSRGTGSYPKCYGATPLHLKPNPVEYNTPALGGCLNNYTLSRKEIPPSVTH